MAILVTGGAGYIGSVTVEDLRLGGEDVVVVDNLVYGHRSAVDESVPFYKGDIGDHALIERILDEHKVAACMHFSAYAYVGESVDDPAKYWENNVYQTIGLLGVLLDRGVRRFVFSSTCASYGEPQYVPIDENHTQSPTNPYGWSKFIIERILESYDNAYDLKFVALRYFNAAGATERLGEDHEPETHLIPLVLQAASGERDHVSIFGNDYPTPDGTAIRDYIHISDLSRAHLLALDYLKNGGASEFINLGNGDGYSVKEVIETACRVTGKEIVSQNVPRREGDPSKLVADARKAREVLGWNPGFPKLEQIIESAWRWHQSRPDGFCDE
ncbi:MAG: UDP-glucose 4-epimerase GalE [Acidobacteriota bacterium]|nr:UDP-glucose 4-epimerase GalE [Acidobacteriota bacterium]MDH3528564.1 UDP-glucose 4-epimerase GalE [Acidobacteriota bacterium]